MSKVVGWLDARVDQVPPEAVLRGMVEAGAVAPGECVAAHSGFNAGIATQAPAGQTSLTAEGEIWAAIVGEPRWLQAELASIASREGHASALRQAYRRQDADLFQSLRGSFALAVIDRGAKRALLGIDRFGQCRMCYSQPRSGGLIFGSNTDAIRVHPAADPALRAQAIFDYLLFGVSPSPRTIYREQFKLLPAQYLVYDGTTARTGFYWEMPYRETTAKTVESLSVELVQTLRSAVARAIEGTDPQRIGAFLSGGLDSSTVAGLLGEAAGRRIKTFTIAFPHDEYNEAHYAEIAARHFNTEHYQYVLTPKDAMAVLADIARAFDEPFGNSSVVPAYYCARLAKEHGVALMLAGDGGDELFAGNSRYVEQQKFALYGTIPPLLRTHLIEPVLFGLPGLDALAIARKARSYVHRAKAPMPERLESYNFYRRVPPSDIFTADVLATIDPEEPINELREVYAQTKSRAMIQRMLHLDLKVALADNDLRKVGTACDMLGVKVAYPFLDDDVAEFSAQLPPSMLIRNLSRRWLFKRALRGFLPPATLAKRKHGFGMPYQEWPRQDREFREIAVDCLRGFKERRYLRADFIDRMIGDGQRGAYDEQVWDIVMLELWFRERFPIARQPPVIEPLSAAGQPANP